MTGHGQLVLSFVILTWNSKKYLQNCFESIREKCQQEEIPFEIIVVDNGSSDGSDSLFQHYQQAMQGNFTCIYLDCNMGTTYPRNIGLKQALGRFICILDSDTELGEGSINEVFRILDEHHEVGIIAPRLLLEDGSVQNSVKKFPTFVAKLLKIPKALFKIKMSDVDFYENFPFKQQRYVDSAISACWYFKRELVDKIGMLDEKIFYAPEDLDYCLRVYKSGKSILYFPAVTVLHHTQQITHRKPLSKISISHFFGLLYYFRKHGGWFFPPT